MINRIFIERFRNIEHLDISPADFNIFLGRNAQGKTSILEAIQFAALGVSRASKDTDLIRWGDSSAVIRLDFERAGVSHVLAVELFTERPRRILLDGALVTRRDVWGRLPVVTFSPDDLFLFKAPPAARRRFLDLLISQLSPVYFSDFTSFRRILAQRNSLLKDIRTGTANPASLSLWDEHFALSAAKILPARLRTVARLDDFAKGVQSFISGEFLALSYLIHGVHDSDTPASDPARWYRSRLARISFLDIQRGSTGIGPHLDDIAFSLNSRSLRSFASQGQIRTAALALALSQLLLLHSDSSAPVLLLDDVFSELDSFRAHRLFAFLSHRRIQSFLTSAADSSPVPARIFLIHGGAVS